eukprot:5514591-Prymnesium_polylepis.1
MPKAVLNALLPVEQRPKANLPGWLANEIKKEKQSPRLVKAMTRPDTAFFSHKCACSASPRAVSSASSPRTAELAARSEVAASLGIAPSAERRRPMTARPAVRAYESAAVTPLPPRPGTAVLTGRTRPPPKALS